jgi:hypothetical protein
LPSITADLFAAKPMNASILKRLLDIVELVDADEGFDSLHG